MLAASLLFKKIYSNAKVSSSSNELTLCLSTLPSPISRDLFLMPIQVSADSFCCGALAVHRALPGPHTAWQRTLVMRFFTLCLLKSLVHRETWRLCCAAPCWHRLWQRLGSRCARDGWEPWLYLLRCRFLPPSLVVPLAPSGTCSVAFWSPVITTHGTEQRWRGSVLIAHPQKEGLCTFKRTKITPNTSPSLKKWRTPRLLPSAPPMSLSPKNRSVTIFSRKPITTKRETFLSRCSQTGGHMHVWKLGYTSLYEAQCPLTPKAFANLHYLHSSPRTAIDDTEGLGSRARGGCLAQSVPQGGCQVPHAAPKISAASEEEGKGQVLLSICWDRKSVV